MYTVLSWTIDLHLASSGITSYAALDRPAIGSDLSAFTLTVWLRTDDRLNQGALTSVTDYPLGRIGSCLRPGMVRGPGLFIAEP